MATLGVVNAIIELWNERYSTERSLDKFLNWMKGQTTSRVNGETFYYLTDIIRYLQGKEVVD